MKGSSVRCFNDTLCAACGKNTCLVLCRRCEVEWLWRLSKDACDSAKCFSDSIVLRGI